MIVQFLMAQVHFSIGSKIIQLQLPNRSSNQTTVLNRPNVSNKLKNDAKTIRKTQTSIDIIQVAFFIENKAQKLLIFEIK